MNCSLHSHFDIKLEACVCDSGWTGRDELKDWGDCHVSLALYRGMYSLLAITALVLTVRTLYVAYYVWEPDDEQQMSPARFKSSGFVRSFHGFQLMFALFALLRVVMGLLGDTRHYQLLLIPALLMWAATASFVSSTLVLPGAWYTTLGYQQSSTRDTSSASVATTSMITRTAVRSQHQQPLLDNNPNNNGSYSRSNTMPSSPSSEGMRRSSRQNSRGWCCPYACCFSCCDCSSCSLRPLLIDYLWMVIVFVWVGLFVGLMGPIIASYAHKSSGYEALLAWTSVYEAVLWLGIVVAFTVHVYVRTQVVKMMSLVERHAAHVGEADRSRLTRMSARLRRSSIILFSVGMFGVFMLPFTFLTYWAKRHVYVCFITMVEVAFLYTFYESCFNSPRGQTRGKIQGQYGGGLLGTGGKGKGNGDGNGKDGGEKDVRNNGGDNFAVVDIHSLNSDDHQGVVHNYNRPIRDGGFNGDDDKNHHHNNNNSNKLHPDFVVSGNYSKMGGAPQRGGGGGGGGHNAHGRMGSQGTETTLEDDDDYEDEYDDLDPQQGQHQNK